MDKESKQKPNVIFVFGDQHRAQACGFAGDPNVQTPNLDRLAGESIRFENAVSGMPVCCPCRASLITGQYPQTHGVFLNDLCLNNNAASIAQAFQGAGYNTAYIGKWHLDGNGRSAYIPPERRHGFDTWHVLECTHNYNHSKYYRDGETEASMWGGYDAYAQTRDAIEVIRSQSRENPLFLMLSWGPPHDPYDTAPEQLKALYPPERLALRKNVPTDWATRTKNSLTGYYAHVTALDECMGTLMEFLESERLAENTVLVYTSDHGDMLGSQGLFKKQCPWDESIRIPFLLRWPAFFGHVYKTVDMPFNVPDMMPTLLDLCGVEIPDTVEGHSYRPLLEGDSAFEIPAALLSCIQPFAGWHKFAGGREYRGIRTRRYTYVRDLHGPWLLYDNQEDPYQLCNLAEEATPLRNQLEEQLAALLNARNDAFHPGRVYVKERGYQVDMLDAIPYTK